MSPWIAVLLALLCGFLESFVDVTRKESKREFNLWSAAWGMRFYGVLVLLPAALLFHPHRLTHDPQFWWSLLGSTLINSVTSVLYMRSLTRSDMSLVLPITTLSPVFMIVTSPFITGEMPSVIGALGVVISGLGVYLLGLDEKSKGPLEPFLLLWKNMEMRLMLGVAFMWSISAPIEKIGMLHGDWLWYAALLNVGVMLLLTPFHFLYGEPRKSVTRDGLLYLGSTGYIAALGLVCQYNAISHILVAYTIGLKRTSVLWGVLWGKLFYNEDKFRARFAAALFILLGAVLILLTKDS